MTDDTAQPLKDLIGDFAVIADQLVPYGQLPPRLSCYAEKYPRWGDLGAQTCESLTAQPAIGPSALNTIIDTARRAIQVAMAGYPDTPLVPPPNCLIRSTPTSALSSPPE